jgi:hypothetical protein
MVCPLSVESLSSVCREFVLWLKEFVLWLKEFVLWLKRLASGNGKSTSGP